MKIIIKKGNNLLTPALEEYIEEKLGVLAKFVKRFDEKSEAQVMLEISRTTNHHKKGDVYMAAADLILPHKVLRAEATGEDIHVAIDEARNKLRLEIENYKGTLEPKRGGKDEDEN